MGLVFLLSSLMSCFKQSMKVCNCKVSISEGPKSGSSFTSLSNSEIQSINRARFSA